MDSVKATLQNVRHTVSNALGSGSNNNDQSAAGTHDHESAATHTEHTAGHSGAADRGTVSLEPGSSPADAPSRTVDGGAHDAASKSSEAQQAGGSSGSLPNELEKTLSGPKDPAVEGEDHPKMTGEGQPGSHSALFGLTPDGKKA